MDENTNIPDGAVQMLEHGINGITTFATAAVDLGLLTDGQVKLIASHTRFVVPDKGGEGGAYVIDVSDTIIAKVSEAMALHAYQQQDIAEEDSDGSTQTS